MINVYPASVLYRWCKVVYNHLKFNGPLYERTKQSIRLCFGISPLLGVVLVQYRGQPVFRMEHVLLHWRHVLQRQVR